MNELLCCYLVENDTKALCVGLVFPQLRCYIFQHHRPQTCFVTHYHSISKYLDFTTISINTSESQGQCRAQTEECMCRVHSTKMERRKRVSLRPLCYIYAA